eukprot:813587_1
MYTNPLRVLDSKNPEVQALLNDAPALGDYLDEESREHFAGLCKLLESAGIAYTVNQRLVRGLDYYNRTVFEWVTNSLGSQGTVCAGGRYDGLVEQLGGRATPAVGFAMGLERLVLLVQAVNPEFKADPVVDIYLVASGADTQSAAMALAERLRDELPGVKLMTNHGGGNFKKQFARADKWGARVAVATGCDVVSTASLVSSTTAEVFSCSVIMASCYESYCNARKSASLSALSATLMSCQPSSRASFAKRSLTTNSRQCSNQCSRYHCGISDQSCCNISPLVTTTVVTSRDCQRIASSAPS